MNENEISKTIVVCAIEVHRTLGGPGLVEAVYEEALVWELQSKNVSVKRQINVPIWYKGHALSSPLRLDLLVAEKVLVECKALSKNEEIFGAQLLTYLRLTELKLGLVINFGRYLAKDGIYRVVNGL